MQGGQVGTLHFGFSPFGIARELRQMSRGFGQPSSSVSAEIVSLGIKNFELAYGAKRHGDFTSLPSMARSLTLPSSRQAPAEFVGVYEGRVAGRVASGCPGTHRSFRR
eukprot:2092414-Amphidinium_carterae.1